MNVRALLASFGAAMALCLTPPAGAAYVLSVDAPATGVVGNNVIVNVNMSIDDGDLLDSIGFKLTYDTSVLDFMGGSAGAFNAGWLDTAFGEAPSGVINVSSLDFLGAFDSTSGSVAQLRFDLIGVGISSLTLSDVLLDNSSTFPVGFQADPVTSASIEVLADNTVPIPGNSLLVGVGLVALGWSRRHGYLQHGL